MVLYSTKQSLENREASFFAIVEIFIAVGIYWYVAYSFDFYWHIVMSVLLAPFLLLRSSKSVDMGLSLLENGVGSHRMYSTFFRFVLESVILVSVVAITYVLFERYLDIDYVIFVLFFLIFCSGLGLGAGLALFGTNDNQRIGILSIFTVLATSIYLGGIHVLIIILSFLALSLIVIVLLRNIGNIGLGIVVVVFLGVGVSLGFLFTVFIYKFISIVSNFSDGYKSIVQNWQYNNFVIDIKYPPEIMFGIENYKGLNEFKLSKFFDQISKNDDDDDIGEKIVESFALTAAYTILYPFALLYRFGIKATFWFYIPLLILVKTPKNFNDNIEIKDFLSKLHRYAYVKLLFYISLLIFLIFLLQHLDFSIVNEFSKPFISVMTLIYMDFSSIELWKLLQTLIVILTIILYFWSDKVWKNAENREMNFKNNQEIKYIFFTNNIKNTISFFYFSFLLFYLMYRFEIWQYKYIPQSIEYFLINMMKIILYKF